MSVSATYSTSSATTSPAASRKSTACRRCGLAARFASRGERACRQCLLESVAGKVRLHLSQSAAVGQCVMVALSGGAGSLMLLDVVSRIMDCGRRRRPFARCVAAVVDTTPLSSSGSERHAGFSQLLSCALSRGFDLAIVPAELLFLGAAATAAAPRCSSVPAPLIAAPDAHVHAPAAYEPARRLYDDEGASSVAAAARATLAALQLAREPGGALHEAHQAMLAAFAACTSRDAREDLLACVVSQGLRIAAAAQACPFILEGTTSDRAAALVVSRVCKGRGFSIPLDVAPAGGRAQ
jgi:hypothetical protein